MQLNGIFDIVVLGWQFIFVLVLIAFTRLGNHYHLKLNMQAIYLLKLNNDLLLYYSTIAQLCNSL